MSLSKTLLEAITEIANSDRLKERIEPNVLHHKTLTESDVQRVLTAYYLFNDEFMARQNQKTKPK